MSKALRLAIWNANGLSQHEHEITAFITDKKIDIMLISETHFTEKSYLKIPNFNIYNTNHPNGSARGGTAIIVKKSIKHAELNKYQEEHIQATSIAVKDYFGTLTITAVYCPPKHSIKKEQYEHFYHTLGKRFIAGGDYNAKHTFWGSRIITSKGRELFRAMQDNNLNFISTGEPTYWPTDRKKRPDVIDFCVTKHISPSYVTAESCLDLSSDHSPVVVTISSNILIQQKQPSLHSKKTNWTKFRQLVSDNLNPYASLKTKKEVDEAVEIFTTVIQESAWSSTPQLREKQGSSILEPFIKDKIEEKRKLRKIWQITREPRDKRKLNKATKNLKMTLKETKNQEIQLYLSKLSSTASTDYSLWKATKKLKQPKAHFPPIRMVNGNWARSNKEKADTFAIHLTKVFQPFPPEQQQEDAEFGVRQFLESPCQMSPPIAEFLKNDITKTINNLNLHKAPGYDLITSKILKELPEIGLDYITVLFNSILRYGHFPSQWKIAQIILIPKPGKPANEVTSYRPISLLPITSKLFEKMLLSKILPILEANKTIPNHQFGFRQQHGTTEQVHRVYNIIRDAFEKKRYCSAAFLDITQAFDKVWHPGLLFKLKNQLPNTFYDIMKSYLEDRHFLVKFKDEITKLHPIKSGVPQGSVLGPMLYTLFTADLPLTKNTLTATFADDTAVLATHQNPVKASKYLQESLDNIEIWLKKWRLKANETKSIHVTFTLRKGSCPPVMLNAQHLTQSDEAKYLGIHLDKRLTWQKHILTKRKQLGINLNKMQWLMGPKSPVSMESKLMIYKSILKPIWTYGIQLWGSASKSNLSILQRFQSKVLRMIANAPWYVTNDIIARDLKMTGITEEATNYSNKYQTRLRNHPNCLAVNLLDQNRNRNIRRLKRLHPLDLLTHTRTDY